jgi:ATP-binding cassette subfamily B protein
VPTPPPDPLFGAIARRGGGWLPLLAVTAVLGALGTLALPMVLGRAVDALVAGGDTGLWLAVAVGVVGLGVVGELVDTYAGTACVTGTTAWLRNRLVGHVLAAGPAATRRFPPGDLVSRVSGHAVEAGQAGVSVIRIAVAALPPVGSLVLLAVIDVWVAGAFLVGLALVALVLRAFTRRTAAATLEYQRIQGLMASRLAESLGGARTVAAAGTIDREERRVLEPLPDLTEQGVRTWRVLSRSAAQGAVVGPLVLVAVLAVGGLALLAHRISAGDLFAASRYAVTGAGLGALTGLFGRLARARAGVSRAAEVLSVTPMPYGRKRLPDRAAGVGDGRLEFHDVTVREDDVTLLDNVSLVVPGGRSVAVVGRSGAGKSVLAALAARLRDPTSGTVRLDGVPLPHLGHEELRRAVGCAFERPALVGATVADAIGLGRDPDLIRSSARATHADGFISRLPAGYDTALDATPLSGGEAQRLGLARAWYAERLLVLDDATSSVDTVTEREIGRTLTGDAGGRTRLIVTHRRATAAAADLVVWLDRGRVRAVGPHERLWARPGYREVFE